ncbi:hypothetical protein GR268_42375 [Rhizobium leguminosarum]|uniref:hypothetical protein n=1 Tax=Rhizobium leguminosarum TaxID=384 RepID=UPI00103118AD|nr:hypothetical protein [Rhizobium leguminosarum]NEJ83129.1 hypothetical protein [Rhizobium leguminosarum]TAX97706.1 hypothetical protein ELH94_14860 [Rhizobium leguminosarum]
MAYKAVIEARKAAEVHHEKVREAVRLGFEMKREQEAKKAALEAARVRNEARRWLRPMRTQPTGVMYASAKAMMRVVNGI